MRFQVLGPLRVTRPDGAQVDVGTPAERRLLAILLTSTKEPVSDDRLIDELWGNEPPPSARHLLRVYVSRVRAALQTDGARDVVARQGGGYRLVIGPADVDAQAFAGALAEGHRLADGNSDAAHEALANGLDLWRATPFADLTDPPPSVIQHAERLERLHREAIGLWAELGLRRGLHHELVPELSELASADPYDEELHAQLMLALYRSGRQTDALQLARDLQGRLNDELGIEASPEIRELYRDILLQAPRLSLGPVLPPSNVPRPATSFVGRADELDAVGGLLRKHRLLTLTGPGGIGKTRLAIEAATRARTEFAGGVWWVDLAPVPDPEHVVGETARVLGLTRAPAPDLLVTLSRSLRDRAALLVLDNCEHVVTAASALVSAVLQATLAPRILVTSRVPLHATGESVFTVPPLGLPEPDRAVSDGSSDAVRLFVERGRAAVPSFELRAGNVTAVAEVCRRLDGLPLAIEMAAARIQVLSPAELVQHLHHRLELLELPTIDSPARHRTLEATIDVSYVLLSEAERQAFERLSVFVGPFDLAAAAVALPGRQMAEVVRTLAGLIDVSMLTAIRGDGTTHYRMLETLRAYGAACLERHRTEDAARRAHAAHYLGLAEAAGKAMTTPGFASWMPRLVDAYDELRQALTWSLQHEPPALALRAAPALWEFWFRQGDAREAGRWSGEMLSAVTPDVPPLLLAAVHQAASFAANVGNDAPTGMEHSNRAVELARQAGSGPMLVPALWGRANVAFAAGDIGAMRADGQEALEVAATSLHPAGAAGALSALAYSRMVTGHVREAARLFDEAIPLYRELDDAAGLVIFGLVPRCGIAVDSGDLAGAEWYGSQALAVSRGTGWEASALVQYGDVLFEQRDPVAAERFERMAIRIALEAGQELWFRRGCRDLARTTASVGQLEGAARLLGAASRGLPAHSIDPRIYRWTEDLCRTRLGDSAFERLASEGRSLTHAQVIDRLVEPAG